MKIGICTSLEQIEVVQQLGFDYIEPSVASIMNMDSDHFASWEEKVRRLPIKCEAFNVLLPRDMKVVGPQVDVDRLREYLDEAFKRVSRLGGQIVVFGSGGARNCPDGWSMQKAEEQFVQACRLAGEAAAANGISVVIEPLNQRECNLLHTVREGLAFTHLVDHPAVQLLADYYHMRQEGEAMEAIGGTGDVLRHAHIANGDDRSYPLPEREDGYAVFFKALRGIGYDGRLSIEGQTSQFDVDAPASLAYLRRLTEG